MKLVEQWDDRGHSVDIRAQFETNGYDASQSILGSDYVDCVRVMCTIQDGYKENIIHSIASSRTHYEKKNMWSRKRYLNISESYESTLKETEEQATKYIDEQCKRKEIRQTDDEITDGLPDSLVGL